MQETQNNKRQNSFFWENPLCQKIYENELGSLAVELITELLQFYKMDYTLSVFPHESNLKEEVTRDKLSKKLGINSDNDKGIPLLISVLKGFFSNGSSPEKKSQQLIKIEENKEEVKENTAKIVNKEVKEFVNKEQILKKEAPAKENDLFLKNKERDQPIIQKKEHEIIKEIQKDFQIREKKQDFKEPIQNNKPQIQPLPLEVKQNPKSFDNFQAEATKETKRIFL